MDDNADGADSLADLLAMHGHEVRTAGTGEEALAAWRAFPADVVILDVGLPGNDGYAVAQRLREVSDHKPTLVMLTGFPGLEARSRAEGFDHHFVKPVDPRIWTDLLGARAPRPEAVDEQSA